MKTKKKDVNYLHGKTTAEFLFDGMEANSICADEYVNMQSVNDKSCADEKDEKDEKKKKGYIYQRPIEKEISKYNILYHNSNSYNSNPLYVNVADEKDEKKKHGYCYQGPIEKEIGKHNILYHNSNSNNSNPLHVNVGQSPKLNCYANVENLESGKMKYEAEYELPQLNDETEYETLDVEYEIPNQCDKENSLSKITKPPVENLESEKMKYETEYELPQLKDETEYEMLDVEYEIPNQSDKESDLAFDKIPCPSNTTGLSVIEGCSCDAGYEGILTIDNYDNNPCIAATCPVNATGVNVVVGCNCDTGFIGNIDVNNYKTNPCTKAPCPANSIGIDVFAGCSCDVGYEGNVDIYNFQNSPCAKAPCPANSTGIEVFSGCQCNDGMSGNITIHNYKTNPCSPDPCPQFSSGVSVLSGCTCDEGYHGNVTVTNHENNPCSPNPCPGNTIGANVISGCSCPTGFVFDSDVYDFSSDECLDCHLLYTVSNNGVLGKNDMLNTSLNNYLLLNCKHMDISNNTIYSIEDHTFDQAQHLTYLNLQQNNITRLPLGLFDELENLKLNSSLLLDFQTQCSMFAFNVVNGHLTRKNGTMYDYVTSCQKLDLSNYNLTSLNPNAFEGLSNLELLDLTKNQIFR
eukprot:Pgem_evm1s19288